jgi:hypothetical protein
VPGAVGCLAAVVGAVQRVGAGVELLAALRALLEVGVALVGDSALFRNGKLLERPIDITAKKTAESHDTDVTETGSSTGFDNISTGDSEGPNLHLLQNTDS